jgi:hypothetical protein
MHIAQLLTALCAPNACCTAVKGSDYTNCTLDRLCFVLQYLQTYWHVVAGASSKYGLVNMKETCNSYWIDWWSYEAITRLQFYSLICLKENISIVVCSISCSSITVLFFILFTRQSIYLKHKMSASISNCGYFNQTSEYQKYYKCNICFAIHLMHNITTTGYLKLHEVLSLFQMEHPSEEE